MEYKYVSALLQEFHVMVELPFLTALLSVLYPETEPQLLYNSKKYDHDNELIRSSLSASISEQAITHPNFFHFLHLSPIKMHLSFSLTGIDCYYISSYEKLVVVNWTFIICCDAISS